MPHVLHCPKWLVLFVIMLHWPTIAVGQMGTYDQMPGMEQAPMGGSCAPCQQSFGAPGWYEGAVAAGDSDIFVSQCGCDEFPPMPQARGNDQAFQIPYQEQRAVQPYGWADDDMMPNTCGCAAPPAMQSACDECGSCNSIACGGCGCQTCCPCGNAAPWWFGAEALIWHTSSASLPPLVTTSEPGTQQLDAGILGRPTTQTLYGGNNIFSGTHGGYRLRGGHYFDQCGMSGIDAEFFMFATRRAGYHGESTGDPILARPFLNADTGLDDAQLVAFPDLASGTIDINAKSNLYSGALHYREIFWKECNAGNGCSQNCRHSGPRSFTLGFQIGPRFVTLRESFGVNERLTSLDPGTQFQIQDSFSTKNQFWGCELGLFGSHQRRRWSLDGGVRLAVGATKQELDVYGQTAVTQAGMTTTSPGGFLAQRTNSGSWDRNRFTLIPQFDVALGYQMADTWTFSVGYSLLYWGQMLRATDQIDPVVNPGLLPPEQIPLTGNLRPEARLHQTDYLAHGITLGLEKRW